MIDDMTEKLPRWEGDGVNAKACYAVAAQIEAEPDLYNQYFFAAPLPQCGTAYCVAGWAAALTEGYQWDVDPYGAALIDHFADRGACPVEVGTRQLGLSIRDARVLFYAMWKPRGDLTVPDALRAIGDGVSVDTVTDPSKLEYFGYLDYLRDDAA